MQPENTLDELINDVLSAEIGLLRKQLAQSESYAKGLEKALDAAIQKSLAAKKCGKMNCGTNKIVRTQKFPLREGGAITLEWTTSPQGPQKISLWFPTECWNQAWPLIEQRLLMNELVTGTWGRAAILFPGNGTARVGSVLVPLKNEEMARREFENTVMFLTTFLAPLLVQD